MNPKVQTPDTAFTASSFEATLRHFAETSDGITFTVYYESVGHTLRCTINKDWGIHGVTVNSKEISFIASKDGGKSLIKYQVHGPEYLAGAKKWFQDAAKQLTPSEKEFTLCASLPQNLVFHAGVTELVVSKATA